MKTFIQFLAEKFFRGTKGRYDYTEIFVNPTATELIELSHGDTDTQIGAWVVGRNLYVWDREQGEHSDVRSTIKADSSSLPLYLYYAKNANVIGVDVSAFSMHSMDQFNINTDEIVNHCQKHPAFKNFKVTDFNTFFRKY